MMADDTVFEDLSREEEQDEVQQYSSDDDGAVKALLETGEEVVEEYREEHQGWIDPAGSMSRRLYSEKRVYTDKDIADLYGKVYDGAEELLGDVEFDAEDVSEFVLRTDTYDHPEQEVLGLYTGALAELLTDREGEPTSIRVNGGGREFDHLFAYARDVDELVVENFRGQDILQHVARQGHAERVVARQVKGGNCCYAVGSRGDVGEVWLEDVEGTYAGGLIGSGRTRRVSLLADTTIQFPKQDASVGRVVLNNVRGDRAGANIAYEGEAGLVVLADVEGESAAVGIGTDKTVISPVRRNVDTIVAYNVEAARAAVRAWDVRSNTGVGREIDEGLEELLESLRDGVTVEKVDAVEEYIEENRGTLDRFKGGYT